MSRRDRYRKNSRDPGGFVAIPWSVLDSRAFQALSHPAKALLFEVARQYHSDDNGRMLLSSRYLAPRGWRSPEVIVRAKRELLGAGLLHETVKGGRPNKASWFAVTWLSLDPHHGYDAGAQASFVRGAYRHENASLTTPAVVAKPLIATPPVVDGTSPTTPDVAIRPPWRAAPTTPDVHPLDVPSPDVALEVLILSRWQDDGGASAGAAA